MYLTLLLPPLPSFLSLIFSVYGSALLSHCLVGVGFRENVKIGTATGVDPTNGMYEYNICMLVFFFCLNHATQFYCDQ